MSTCEYVAMMVLTTVKVYSSDFNWSMLYWNDQLDGGERERGREREDRGVSEKVLEQGREEREEEWRRKRRGSKVE